MLKYIVCILFVYVRTFKCTYAYMHDTQTCIRIAPEVKRPPFGKAVLELWTLWETKEDDDAP